MPFSKYPYQLFIYYKPSLDIFLAARSKHDNFIDITCLFVDTIISTYTSYLK